MANYDRRILVPYLQDVCSTELLCSRLSREIENCRREINQLSNRVNQKIIDPIKPHPSAYATDSDKKINNFVYILIWVIIPIIVGCWVYSAIGTESVGFLLVVALVVIFLGGPGILEVISDNEDENIKYKNAVEEYNKKLAINQNIRQQIPDWRDKIREKQSYLCTLQARFNSASKLRDEVYDVNIIPSKYRDIHAAYYLYDYFNTSRETDLDKIIQTLLLEEIKQKLDKIIEQNEQIILNQRIQLALQERQNLMIQENHHEQMEAIARLERNQELQMDYQQMIIKNQVVTNFILEAEYLYTK